MGSLVSLKTARRAGRGAPRVPGASGDDAAPGDAAWRRSLATSAAVRDWLETQARVVEYWRDLLADAGESAELVEALDAHAAFLNAVAARR